MIQNELRYRGLVVHHPDCRSAEILFGQGPHELARGVFLRFSELVLPGADIMLEAAGFCTPSQLSQGNRRCEDNAAVHDETDDADGFLWHEVTGGDGPRGTQQELAALLGAVPMRVFQALLGLMPDAYLGDYNGSFVAWIEQLGPLMEQLRKGALLTPARFKEGSGTGLY